MQMKRNLQKRTLKLEYLFNLQMKLDFLHSLQETAGVSYIIMICLTHSERRPQIFIPNRK